MNAAITHIKIRFEQDIVYTRKRARLIAGILGFDRLKQTQISTAVSEITRNAYQYAQGGEVEFFIGEGAASSPPCFTVVVRDHGQGIEGLDAVLEGRYVSRTGMGLGIVGSRRLLDHFHIETTLGQGTTVTLGKRLPPTAPPVTPAVLRRIGEALAAIRADSPLEEICMQNQELLATLELLRQRDEEVTRVNAELTETNTGVVALYIELEQRSEQLQQAQQKLLARNDDLKGFAYTVSHDLKAPLRGIVGYAQELERKHSAGLSERARFCMSQIITASHNLERLIDDLLHFASLDAETPALTAVALPGLVAAILNDRSLLIAGQHTEVTVDIPFTTLWTWEIGLAQVLANLIDNALKYSRKASPPRVGIRAEEADTGWRLSVSDNGIGFDMKYHERIYGLFARLVRAEEFEGTGAGLAIVKKVLDKLGGSIRAEAQPGFGATFYIELPKPQTKTETEVLPL
ncbi:MAG: ATP-binding protein [Methylococcaceae bacterium]